MAWEAKLIEYLQAMAGGAFDYIMFILTFVGDKLFFIAVACVLYWCVSKKFGFRFITVYLFSVGCTDLIKSIFSRTRPYAKYDSIKSIFTKTEGWSFPSGHSSSIAAIGSQLTQKAYKKKKYFIPILITFIILTLTVMFTRVYLGQHYPTDVIAGAIVGTLLALIFGQIFTSLETKILSFWKVAVSISIACTIILIVGGMAHESESLIQAFGAYAAVSLGYTLEQKYVGYHVRSGGLLKQAAKLAIGLGVAALILLGGGQLLKLYIISGSIPEVIFAWYVLYFIVGIWIMLGANYLFKKLKL